MMSWAAKKDRIVNFATNVADMDMDMTIERWNKKDQMYKNVKCLSIVGNYNHMKWHIDEKCSLIAPVMFPFWARRPFRAKGNDR